MDDDKIEQKLLSDSAKFYAGLLLFGEYSEIAANTLDYLYTQELIRINPMLGWNTALATQEIKKMAAGSLLEKLEGNPQLLFDVSPLLSERLETCTKQFEDALQEMLIRIRKDRQEIQNAFFSGSDFGKIIKFDSSGADRHQTGRFTSIIITEHGKFLYKPRKMEADTVLFHLVSDLFPDVFILPKALDFGSYGYAEFLVDEPARTKEAAEKFFYRLGGACAIFQAFGSCDFHCENILEKGEFPAIVDLETFLGIPIFSNKENVDLFQRDLQYSIFYSFILPKRSEGYELSPLLYKDKNSILPLIEGKREDVRGYLPCFDAGFQAIYHRCMENKPYLLTYLERFSNCSFRCLLRNTNDYARMLQGLYSVKLLFSKACCKERVEALRTVLSCLGQEIADEELIALLRGDVPNLEKENGEILRVDRLYLLQYMMILPNEWHSPLADHYMKMADSESGRAFLLSDNDRPVLYAVLNKENAGWVLNYIDTDKEKRRKNYASYLIRKIVLQMDQYVRVHLVHSHPYYDAVTSCLDKLGFIVNDTSSVYAVSVGESIWRHMDELQLLRMKEFLLRDGSKCIPFCKMGSGIREQLIKSSSNHFSNSLNPEGFLKNSVENVDLEISNVLVRDKELEAYTLITRPRVNTVSIEQIAEAQSKIGSGRIVAPLCASLEAIRNCPEITMMKMTISDQNTRSYRFVMEILKGQKMNVTKNSSYIVTAAMLK